MPDDTPRPRLNARDDIFNGASRPLAGSRNVVELGMAEAECRRALAEFTAALPDFCRRLDIAPAILNLRTPELLMLICMRQQTIIDDLAAQIGRLLFPPTTQE